MLAIAGDALIQGPSRALAWRLLHDPELLAAPAWLRPWLPAGAPFDRDPLALLLGGGATLLATLYLAACLAGAGARLRASLLVCAVFLVVVLPTALHVSVGVVTGRPFGQDGGVVQLPLALERLASGQSPHGGDYSDSMLGKQSRASSFWRAYGGNPIVRHHAYLPGTHLAMAPAFLLARATGVPFDTRLVTLAALLIAALFAQGFFDAPERRLSAAALVLLNPLVYWHQAFGANDILFVALLLASAHRFQSGRRVAAGVLLGLACATKQLAWPYAPFLLLQASGAASLRDLASRETLARLRAPAVSALVAFVVVVLPVIALDPRAFFADIVAYNIGFGGDLYPFGGTPGLGFANLLIVAGAVRTLRDSFSMTGSIALLVPLVLLLARAQLRRNDCGSAFAAGSVALLATIYFSRVPHPNYLIAPAILLPLAALLGALRAEGALLPLGLLALAATLVDRSPFGLVSEDALLSGWPPLPVSADPIGLALAAVTAGLAVACAAAAACGASSRSLSALALFALVALVAVPTFFVARIDSRSSVVRVVEPTLAPTTEAREPWSPSFRLEPAGPPVASGSPAAWALSRVLGALGVRDGRLLALLASVMALLAAHRLAPQLAWAGLAVMALQPNATLATVFASSVFLWLAILLAALSASARGNSRAVAALAGPLLLLDHWLSRVGDPGPGVGLVDVASYAGFASAPLLHALLALGGFGVAAAALWVWRRAASASEIFAGLALALLIALVCAPSASAFSLCAPLALLLLAASPGSSETAPTPA